ncbi:hypothetical protein D7231_03005 [Streptomyces klenkii]|uniref:Ricin B lectin domain-containing protein n=2 Tax=Streptomyces klenkii TaxID=1420899 RepID=A0A3B0C347_9ACTN|nr:hypothetical protein D7231_03005 [Streptomyces klenkii]
MPLISTNAKPCPQGQGQMFSGESHGSSLPDSTRCSPGTAAGSSSRTGRGRRSGPRDRFCPTRTDALTAGRHQVRNGAGIGPSRHQEVEMRSMRVPALLAAAVFAAAGMATGTAHSHDKSAAPAAVPLWRSLAGFEKCVGLANNGSTANGTELVLWDCHGHPDQQWAPSAPAGLIQSLAAANKCVGLANNGSTANGTRLVVWDCHGNYDQRWAVYSDNSVRSQAAANKCVGLADNGSTANGTRLVIWDCHGNYDQRWRFGF